jgi:hypothetical protein
VRALCVSVEIDYSRNPIPAQRSRNRVRSGCSSSSAVGPPHSFSISFVTQGSRSECP